MDIIQIAITIVTAAVGAWMIWGCYLLQRDREAERSGPSLVEVDLPGAKRESLEPLGSSAG